LGAYVVIIGDTVPSVLGYYVGQDSILANRQIMVLLIGVIAIFPLTLIRDVGRLGFVSILSITCVFFITIAISIQGYTDPRYAHDEPINYTFANKDFFPAIGTMAFAYVCCQASFILHRSMAKPSRRNWRMFSVRFLKKKKRKKFIASFFAYSHGIEWRCWACHNSLRCFCSNRILRIWV